MNKAQLSLLLGVVAASTLLLGVTALYPSFDDLWVENPFWNGLSEFYVEVKPQRLGSVSLLQSLISPGDTTLFIIGPSTGFTGEEVQWIMDYIQRGGRLVLADDFGTGNQLLEGLGVEARFSGGLLIDPLFREKSAMLPYSLRTDYVEVDKVVFNHATSLIHTGGARVMAWSSQFSVLEGADEGSQTSLASRPLISEQTLGEGGLVLVADSSTFINSMINLGDNRQLLGALLRGDAIIDEAHSTPSRLSMVKAQLAKVYTALGSLEFRYGLALIMVAGVMSIRLDEGEGPVDEVEAVMAAHPEYDRGHVERLEDARRIARGE